MDARSVLAPAGPRRGGACPSAISICFAAASGSQVGYVAAKLSRPLLHLALPAAGRLQSAKNCWQLSAHVGFGFFQDDREGRRTHPIAPALLPCKSLKFMGCPVPLSSWAAYERCHTGREEENKVDISVLLQTQ